MLELETQGHNPAFLNSEFNKMMPPVFLDVANCHLRVVNLNDDRVVETATCKRLQAE